MAFVPNNQVVCKLHYVGFPNAWKEKLIKVEKIMKPRWDGTYALPTYIYNSGKDMISLNLKSEEGLKIMHQLLAKADVFITNNRPAALERLGLHYDQLKEKYPRLIYGIVTGYGEKGPDANKQAYDTTAFWSRSGFLRDTAVVGETEYYPVEAPSALDGRRCAEAIAR